MNEQQSVSLETINYFFDIGKYDRVIELGKEALRDHYNNAYLWYMLGYSNHQVDDYDEAEEQLIEAMNLGYNRVHILTVLGIMYMDQRKSQKAEETFLEALRLDPNDAVAHASYALLMRKTGHSKKAHALIKKAIELNPENAYVLRTNLAFESINDNKQHQMEALEQYMNCGDTEFVKLIQLGINANNQNNIKESREYFRQAYLLKPEDKQLLATLERIDFVSHPLLGPNHLVTRLGGPMTFWVIGVFCVFLLTSLGLETALRIFVICYLALALYTWISEPLVKLIMKKRG